MILALPESILGEGHEIKARARPRGSALQPVVYSIGGRSGTIAQIALAVVDELTDAVVLRGLRLVAGPPIDEVVRGLRVLCEAIWQASSVHRIELTCGATDAPARQAMAALGATLEGVRRSIPADGADRLEDQAQYSILRDEWAALQSRLAPPGRPAAKEITIRPAKPRDLGELYDLERSAFGVGYDLGHLRQFLDIFEGLVLLAEESDGEAVGYLLPAPTYRDPSKAWILSMGVRRELQGQGIGRALLDAGIELLKSIDVETVLLSVDPNSTRAINLYRSAGFRFHESVPNYFGLHEDRLTMSSNIRA